MFFEINNTLYAVKFRRSGTATEAELCNVAVGEKRMELDETNIKGIAYCNPKDRFEKSKGRKVALAKLLNQMHQFFVEGSHPDFNMTKDIREQIWASYFVNHKK